MSGTLKVLENSLANFAVNEGTRQSPGMSQSVSQQPPSQPLRSGLQIKTHLSTSVMISECTLQSTGLWHRVITHVVEEINGG